MAHVKGIDVCKPVSRSPKSEQHVAVQNYTTPATKSLEWIMTARAEQLLTLQAIQNKEFTSSDLSKVCEKLLRQPRGGCCFEQNTLFAAVLRSLGYDVYTAAARYRTYTFSDIHCLLPQARKEC